METLSFTLLSTVDIVSSREPSTTLTITAGKVRTVLAVLLLAAGRRIPIEQLIEEVWAQPPPSAVKNLQLYVHRLRRVLDAAAPGAGQRLRRSADGYCLRVERRELDLFVAESLVERALALGVDPEAADLLDRALASWSDHPLGGITLSPSLAAVAEQLRDRRLTLLERRSELDLAMGRYAAAADRLRPMVARYPFRETAHALLITALRGAGQRAKAVEVFHQLRRGLGDELAIEPGPAVRAAYQALITE